MYEKQQFDPGQQIAIIGYLVLYNIVCHSLYMGGAKRAAKPENIMATYSICNQTSGADLGEFEGDTEQEALDAFARNAGYNDHADACAQVGGGEDLIVKLVEPK